MTGIVLPFPISTNRLYRAVGGSSILSASYRAWKREAGLLIMSQRPQKHIGPVKVTAVLCAPDKRKRDADNSLKCLLDALKDARVIEADDNSIVREVTARWVSSGEPCTVFVEQVA